MRPLLLLLLLTSALPATGAGLTPQDGLKGLPFSFSFSSRFVNVELLVYLHHTVNI